MNSTIIYVRVIYLANILGREAVSGMHNEGRTVGVTVMGDFSDTGGRGGRFPSGLESSGAEAWLCEAVTC